MAASNRFIRLIASFGIAFVTLLLFPFSAMGGAWLYPGKVITRWAVACLPTAWVFGDPASDTYWPEISAVGFAIMCAYIFWAIAIFLLWEGVRIYELRSKEGPHA